MHELLIAAAVGALGLVATIVARLVKIYRDITSRQNLSGGIEWFGMDR